MLPVERCKEITQESLERLAELPHYSLERFDYFLNLRIQLNAKRGRSWLAIPIPERYQEGILKLLEEKGYDVERKFKRLKKGKGFPVFHISWI